MVLFFYNICILQRDENIPLYFLLKPSFAFHICIVNSLEMIFVYNVSSFFFYYYLETQLSQNHLLKTNFLVLSVINQVSIYAWVYLWPFWMVYWSICLSFGQYYNVLNYFSFIISLST